MLIKVVMDSDEIEPSIITAIRLARMRDGNMGQADEIEALFDILKGSEKLMRVTNDVVWALLTKKQNMSQADRHITMNESYSILKNAFEKFVTAKIKRIEKFIRYFQILEEDVAEESKKLEKFEKEWETIHRKLDELDINHYLSLSRNDSYTEINLFKNDVIQTSLPLAQELNELENQMQKKVIGKIAFLAKKTKPVDTNELYKLLTGEP